MGSSILLANEPAVALHLSNTSAEAATQLRIELRWEIWVMQFDLSDIIFSGFSSSTHAARHRCGAAFGILRSLCESIRV